MHFYFPRLPRAVHGRERHPQPAQPADAARRAGARPARVGRLPHRGDRHVRRPRRRRVRIASLADLGQGSDRRIPVPATGSVLPTCTTRPCGSSTRASPGSRSPRTSRCRRHWRRRGTPTATTVRSATTSRRCTSATWAGSTATPAGCGRTRPEAIGPRYVEAMGGIDRVVEIARKAFDDGDFRWAATLLDHAIFTDENHAGARELYADTLEQLAYGAENAVWRNFFLSGATELREGNFGTPDPDRVTVDHGPADPGADVRHLRDQHQRAAGVGSRRRRRHHLPRHRDQLSADAAQRRAGLPQGARGRIDGTGDDQAREQAAAVDLCRRRRDSPGLEVTGDANALPSMLAVVDRPDPGFNIITP